MKDTESRAKCLRAYVCTYVQCTYIDILISSLSLMNDETDKGGEKKGTRGGEKRISRRKGEKGKGIERRSYKNFLEE